MIILDVDKVKTCMKQKGMKHAEFADATGISRTTIYQLLNGKRQPRQSTLDKICAVLGEEPETLTVSVQRSVQNKHAYMAETIVRLFNDRNQPDTAHFIDDMRKLLEVLESMGVSDDVKIRNVTAALDNFLDTEED